MAATDNGTQGTGSTDYVTHFPKGSWIFREGEAGDAMFIIQDGEVEIISEVKGRQVRLALLEEGDFFGEMAILEDLPRIASARAAQACELLRIDASTFDQMARHNPEIPVRMLRKLSARLRQLGKGALSEAAPEPPAEHTRVPEPASPTKERGQATLEHVESGARFPVAATGETTVGRVDPATGFRPDVELKPLDTQRSTSRRHARLVGADGRYAVKEEIGVANGTFVNGKRIATGVEIELADGDEISFGLVKLVFHLG